jgi:hypothetical protein
MYVEQDAPVEQDLAARAGGPPWLATEADEYYRSARQHAESVRASRRNG